MLPTEILMRLECVPLEGRTSPIDGPENPPRAPASLSVAVLAEVQAAVNPVM